ncbi:MAG: type II toxin-antitoxin system VapC family toxin [Sideroxydans sp.]|nr:type II toxin-antitoxin system VapC family toxin [Sideroxydans sp.]
MSGISWLLDTNVVIGLLKQQPAAIALAESQKLELSQSAVSQITRMELLGFPGLVDEEERAILEFLQSCQVLLIDEAVEGAAIRLRRAGLCKLPDAIIAATAQMHQLKLLTLDERLAKISASFREML